MSTNRLGRHGSDTNKILISVRPADPHGGRWWEWITADERLTGQLGR